MKNKYSTKVWRSCWLLLLVLPFQSCDHKEVESYNAEHFLFFERWKQISANERARIDTVGYSFSHYVGETELVHEFQVNLIGDLLTEDTEYSVVVVDSLTTASAEHYSIPEHPLFRQGKATDVFPVTLYKHPSLKGKEVYLTLRLKADNNFGSGYVSYTDVRIRFNDMEVKPLWWSGEVETAYLGTYSFKKLETLIAANEGFTTMDGMSDTEKRKVALNAKAYIALHSITEEDGSPMLIPMY